ncbi:MAG: hypothetical protein J0L97_01840 [Alphaproteobacteria bacterium]|nr:hypothetical protein [Alphaproteobacteria bacterium]
MLRVMMLETRRGCAGGIVRRYLQGSSYDLPRGLAAWFLRMKWAAAI